MLTRGTDSRHEMAEKMNLLDFFFFFLNRPPACKKILDVNGITFQSLPGIPNTLTQILGHGEEILVIHHVGFYLCVSLSFKLLNTFAKYSFFPLISNSCFVLIAVARLERSLMSTTQLIHRRFSNNMRLNETSLRVQNRKNNTSHYSSVQGDLEKSSCWATSASRRADDFIHSFGLLWCKPSLKRRSGLNMTNQPDVQDGFSGKEPLETIWKKHFAGS